MASLYLIDNDECIYRPTPSVSQKESIDGWTNGRGRVRRKRESVMYIIHTFESSGNSVQYGSIKRLGQSSSTTREVQLQQGIDPSQVPRPQGLLGNLPKGIPNDSDQPMQSNLIDNVICLDRKRGDHFRLQDVWLLPRLL